MARWSAVSGTFTPVAVADTTAFTANGYFALQGGSTTQRINILEIYCGGQAGASSAQQLVLARDSTVAAATMSGGTLAQLDPATAALAAPMIQHTTTSGTKPQRSSTLYLLNLSFNAFGGVVRWVAAPGEEIGMLGNTASNGEVSLSHLSGGTPGLMGAHFIFEPF